MNAKEAITSPTYKYFFFFSFFFLIATRTVSILSTLLKAYLVTQSAGPVTYSTIPYKKRFDLREVRQ